MAEWPRLVVMVRVASPPCDTEFYRSGLTRGPTSVTATTATFTLACHLVRITRKEVDVAMADVVPDVDSVEARIVLHPFGDSRYVTDLMHEHYVRRLGQLSDAGVRAAGEIVDALHRSSASTRYRVLGDTVFRAAVQHLQVYLETGTEYGMPPARCKRLLDGAATRLAEPDGALVGSSLTRRIGSPRRHGWAWQHDAPANEFTDAFRALVEGHSGMTLCTPDDAESAVLARAVELLEAVLPTVSPHVLSHTHLVAVFDPSGGWESARSSSQFRLSGTIFLSRRTLTDVWTAAEHLLHESLHQQLYDIRRAHTLLLPGFDRADAPRTVSLWNRPGAQGDNLWDVHRTLAAFHVYVHLTLLAHAASADTPAAVDLRARYGPVHTTPATTAAERAAYLSNQLRETGWDDLGPAGQHLVGWLDPVLDTLAPHPVVRGSFLHLILDRYRREASTLELRAPCDGVASSRLADLTTREIACTREVLDSAGQDTRTFDSNTEAVRTLGAVGRLVATRRLIADALLAACPRRYELADTRVPDERVRSMVEQSSRTLNDLLQPTVER
jgi:hypothetical protein